MSSVKLAWIAVLVVMSVPLIRAVVHPGREKPAVTLGQTYCTGSTPCVTTYHNDNNRDGVNPNERTFLASQGINPVVKQKVVVDGEIFAQPLYIHRLFIPAQKTYRNMAFVATENNTVYSIDADTGAIIGENNLNAAVTGTTETAVPYLDLPFQPRNVPCSNIIPEVGITGTPVIDLSVTPPVLYVVSKHEDTTNGIKSWVQKLHALSTTTLAEMPGSPVTISATDFDPLLQNQRAALALEVTPPDKANVFISWGAHCDVDTAGADFRGFVMEYQYDYTTETLTTNPVAVFNDETVTGGSDAGIWMSGGGPVIDGANNLYVPTGNGKFSSTVLGAYGQSVVKLDANLNVLDTYTPPDYVELNNGGLVSCGTPCQASCGSACQISLPGTDSYDLASGGVVLLAPSFALNSPELVAAGKQGMMYVIYTNSPMGGLDAGHASAATVACTTATQPTSGAIAQCFTGMQIPNPFGKGDAGSHGTPAFWAGNNAENYLYTVGASDYLRAFQLTANGGVGTFANTLTPPTSADLYKYPGATPSVSWNVKGSDSDAIVWVLNTNGAAVIGTNGLPTPGKPAVLYAYTAIPNGATFTKLWDSSSSGQRGPGAVKFMPPTVVDGKILVGGGVPGYLPGDSNCPTFPTACGQLSIYGP